MTDKQTDSERDILPGSDDPMTDDDPIRLTLSEETMEARVVERDQGKIRIHKRVETHPVTARVELHHDDMEIDEISMDEKATERREPWYEGDTLMVPVYEEVLTSYTELVLRKVIRVHNRGITEPVDLTGTVRREVVDIEHVDADGDAPSDR